MLDRSEIKNILLNSKIVKVFRFCEIACFVFETVDKRQFHLHVSCFIRIIDSDRKIVTCTANMYERSKSFHKKWYQKYDWSKFGTTVYDEAIKDHEDKLLSANVSCITFENNDLSIFLNNGMRIDVFASVSKYDDTEYSEDYRIFEKGKLDEHFEVPSTY